MFDPVKIFNDVSGQSVDNLKDAWVNFKSLDRLDQDIIVGSMIQSASSDADERICTSFGEARTSYFKYLYN